MRKQDKIKIRGHLIAFVSYLEQKEYDLSTMDEDTEDIKAEIKEINEIISKLNKEINQ